MNAKTTLLHGAGKAVKKAAPTILTVVSAAGVAVSYTHLLREQKIDRYMRIAVAGVELVLPLMFYGIWMRRGFKFEESGVYSSTTFRNLFSRFRPTK